MKRSGEETKRRVVQFCCDTSVQNLSSSEAHGGQDQPTNDVSQ